MWFTETPWPPIVICSALAVALLAGWNATGRIRHLFGVVALVLISGTIYAVEQFIVTDAEEIEASLLEFTTAFQQKRLPDILELISDRAPEIKLMVSAKMLLVEVHDDLTVSDVGVDMKSENSRGIVHFRANATVSVTGRGNLGWQNSRWELTWQREDEHWRVIRIRRLNFMTGEEIADPLSRGR